MRILQFSIFFCWLQIFSTAQTAKVVGYLPIHRIGLNNSIEYCKLSHLNISFANPDTNGIFLTDDFTPIIKRAKEQNPNIVICISLGGGALSEQKMKNWVKFIDTTSNRPVIISNIISFVESNNLDGVDFDLEWDAVTAGYSAFVIQLKDSLRNHNKLLTAALPAVYRYPLITNDALACFDFINIMAYDETGPWSPNKPGQHSSFDFASRAVFYWKNQGVPAEKLTLGLPFYGYNFDNQNNVFSFTYSEMVGKNVLFADVDKVGNAYYNGRATIEKKVELAVANTRGIMIWEIGQDRFDEYSLLKTIHKKFTSMGVTTTGLCGNTVSADKITKPGFSVHPNPATKKLYIDMEITGDVNVTVFNIFGQKLNLIPQKRFNKIEYDVSRLAEGLYFIKMECSDYIQTQKIMIKR